MMISKSAGSVGIGLYITVYVLPFRVTMSTIILMLIGYITMHLVYSEKVFQGVKFGPANFFDLRKGF